VFQASLSGTKRLLRRRIGRALVLRLIAEAVGVGVGLEPGGDVQVGGATAATGGHRQPDAAVV
jgi:hypothetical protein